MNSLSVNPLVTAVITTYNRPQLVRRAIRSVVAQTYEPLEIIVVEDGSDSGVEAWLQDEGLSHIRYVRYEENKGLAAARNTGLRLARGKYVAFLDDDDEWVADKLLKQVELAETKSEGWAAIYCGALGVGAHGQIIHKPSLRGDIRAEIVQKGWPTLPVNSSLFVRQALQQVGGYDEDLASHTEFGIWMKMAQAQYKADYVDEYLVIYYQHQGAKMMRDVKTRLQATDAFIEKWFPEWKKWFGKDRAREYCAQFYNLVLTTLGATSIEQGNVLVGLRCYWYVIRRNPWRFRSYIDSVVAFAKVLFRYTPFYRLIRRLLSRATSIYPKTRQSSL